MRHCARRVGGGFLTDHFPNAAKAIWEFNGIFATSRHIPGVKFAGLIHPGLIGTAPSKARARGFTQTTWSQVIAASGAVLLSDTDITIGLRWWHKHTGIMRHQTRARGLASWIVPAWTARVLHWSA